MVISNVTDKEPIHKLHEQCIHHWIIDTADGSTSFGKCKHCGLVKAFSNSIENPYIDGEHGMPTPLPVQELR